MSTHDTPQRPDNPSTYFITDRQQDRELHRLLVQDQLLTESMGGVLSEQPDPTLFHRILDIGCGPGGWVLETARTYPWMHLDGIDISQRMIAAAREQAEAEHLGERVRFHVMDALRMLEFPAGSFDLVNLRSSVSFLRTWEWPKMFGEVLRIAQVGGVIRISEGEVVPQGHSPALIQLQVMVQCALYRSGHLFTDEPGGLTNHLERLFTQYGAKNVQRKAHVLDYRPGTPQAEASHEDVRHLFPLIRPFLQKWGCASDFEAVYQQALMEIGDPHYHVTANFLTVWGNS